MKYYLPGKSGLRVSELALGTMTFGTDWGVGFNSVLAYITNTCSQNGAGWSVGNCLNFDLADESDKNRYSEHSSSVIVSRGER